MRIRNTVVFLIALVVLALPAGAGASRNLYISGYASSNLAIFDVGPGGALTAKPGGPLPAGNGAEGIAITPDGKFLYVADQDGNTIQRFAVGPVGTLGSLPAVPTPGVDSAPYGITVTPDGRFLYAALTGTDNVAGFAIGADGALTPVPGSPVLAVEGAEGIATSTDGRSLYMTGPNEDELRAFTIAVDGSLTPLTTLALTPSSQPFAVSVTPDGRFLYTADYNNDTISGFSLGAGGTPVPLSGSPFPAPGGPYAGLVVAPSGGRLYVTNYDNDTISALAIAADGGLTAIGAPLPAGDASTSAAITPNGRNVYSTNFASPGQLFSFSVNADGTLATVGDLPILSGVDETDFGGVAISPDQPPVAAFTSAVTGRKVKLDASASTDPDGAVASYAWDFGDGATFTGTTPTTSHTYAKEGNRTVTLTLTDDEGCSATRIYTGQNVLCNGSTVATSASAGIDGAKLKSKGKQKQKGGKVVVAVKVGAAEQVKAVVKGKLSVKGSKGSIPLKKVSKAVKAGKKKTLKLKPKSSTAARRVAAALAEGGSAKAKLSAKLSDAAGNTLSRKLSARLEG